MKIYTDHNLTNMKVMHNESCVAELEMYRKKCETGRIEESWCIYNGYTGALIEELYDPEEAFIYVRDYCGEFDEREKLIKAIEFYAELNHRELNRKDVEFYGIDSLRKALCTEVTMWLDEEIEVPF